MFGPIARERKYLMDCNFHYYSFKIFSRFWLVKTTRIIHHNQVLFTKFGKHLRHIESLTSKVERIENYWTNDVKMTSKVQYIYLYALALLCDYVAPKEIPNFDKCFPTDKVYLKIWNTHYSHASIVLWSVTSDQHGFECFRVTFLGISIQDKMTKAS